MFNVSWYPSDSILILYRWRKFYQLDMAFRFVAFYVNTVDLELFGNMRSIKARDLFRRLLGHDFLQQSIIE